MKKIIILLLLILPLKVNAISAKSYIVMDSDSKRVLMGSGINTKRLIASTTKIMSCVIALEYGNLDNQVTVGKEVLKAYGSNVYLEVGETISLRDLLYGMMLRSGNDAAIEIAYNVAGSMDNFVILMNNKAKDLGMNNTNFINDNGLEDDKGNGNTSTSYDMALLMSYALNNKDFATIINTKNYQVKTNYKSYYWLNKNKLLSSYKYLIGGKTGFTKKARRTLVTAAKKDNKEIIVVTLDDGNDFNDHRDLYERVFNNYNRVKVLDKSKFKIDSNYYEKLYINNDIYVLLSVSEEKKVTISYNINNIDNYNDGDIVGEVNISLNNKVIAKDNVYASKDEKETKGVFRRIIDFLVFWD